MLWANSPSRSASSLRLFGNMMGEETLIAVFLGLGVSIPRVHPPARRLSPHIPFIFLAMLPRSSKRWSLMLLSTIYMALCFCPTTSMRTSTRATWVIPFRTTRQPRPRVGGQDDGKREPARSLAPARAGARRSRLCIRPRQGRVRRHGSDGPAARGDRQDPDRHDHRRRVYRGSDDLDAFVSLFIFKGNL